MKKAVMGAFAGAVIYFAWGAFSWMVLPWHNAVMKDLPEEQLLLDTMRVVVKEPGVYFFPTDRTPEGRMDPAVWVEKYRWGPSGMLAYTPGGRVPMTAATFAISFSGALLLSILVLSLLWLARDRARTRACRVGIAASVGLAAGLAAHVPYWNWFGFPPAFTAVAVADLVIGFALMGAALSFFVPKTEA